MDGDNLFKGFQIYRLIQIYGLLYFYNFNHIQLRNQLNKEIEKHHEIIMKLIHKNKYRNAINLKKMAFLQLPSFDLYKIRTAGFDLNHQFFGISQFKDYCEEWEWNLEWIESKYLTI